MTQAVRILPNGSIGKISRRLRFVNAELSMVLIQNQLPSSACLCSTFRKWRAVRSADLESAVAQATPSVYIFLLSGT